ncbi:hypothetical protein [Oerskovia merdavium]|uniref:Uncharacterized protein n=1 Tax=Oerskovia merdavium TaxID=2762227 RepID=A0ABR8U441_9CELL|nr:hypothetical protein [Oerskovia merdavium]MBD7982803.1 hypothetical protein [Oerskovia merdavium]
MSYDEQAHPRAGDGRFATKDVDEADGGFGALLPAARPADLPLTVVEVSGTTGPGTGALVQWLEHSTGLGPVQLKVDRDEHCVLARLVENDVTYAVRSARGGCQVVDTSVQGARPAGGDGGQDDLGATIRSARENAISAVAQRLATQTVGEEFGATKHLPNSVEVDDEWGLTRSSLPLVGRAVTVRRFHGERRELFATYSDDQLGSISARQRTNRVNAALGAIDPNDAERGQAVLHRYLDVAESTARDMRAADTARRA